MPYEQKLIRSVLCGWIDMSENLNDEKIFRQKFDLDQQYGGHCI